MRKRGWGGGEEAFNEKDLHRINKTTSQTNKSW
jgi:hypothetical protein